MDAPREGLNWKVEIPEQVNAHGAIYSQNDRHDGVVIDDLGTLGQEAESAGGQRASKGFRGRATARGRGSAPRSIFLQRRELQCGAAREALSGSARTPLFADAGYG